MTGKKRPVTDEQLGAFARRSRELEGRFMGGLIDPDATMRGLQFLIDGTPIPSTLSTSTRNRIPDPARKFRKVDGLLVVGPRELSKALFAKGSPLEKPDDWLTNIPPVPEEWKDWLLGRKFAEGDWRTSVALVLVPPTLGRYQGEDVPNTLCGMQRIWGVSHDGIAGGFVRQDVLWSNWFVDKGGNKFGWAREPVTTEFRWVLTYEHPAWTARQSYEAQTKAAVSRELTVSTAAEDAFVLSVVLAATGIRLRLSTYSRTATEYDGYPLDVDANSGGVCVSRGWDPGDSYSGFGLSVQGVPRSLIS